MSSAQEANNAFNLVTDKISRLITRSQKMKAGDADAKRLAHEIAVTLATAFAQHGSAATSFSPRLLSCTAEIWDNSAPNGKLKGLPDWAAISDDDVRIRDHPLFYKTVGFAYPSSTPSSPAPAPPAPAAPSTPEVASTLLPISSHSASPAPMVKHDLFVAGTKCKASTPETLPDPEVIEAPKPLPKKCKMARAAREFSLPPPADGVIYVRKRPVDADAGAGAQPARLPETESAGSTVEEQHTVRLFPEQCERCIKDDIPCTVILGKKLGKVRKCCRNCDVKKTKCVHLPAAWQELLRAATALKKTKAAATADKKARNPTQKNKAAPSRSKSRTRSNTPHSTRATSRIRPTSPADDEDEDAEGDDDLELGAQLPKDAAPTPAVDNDINMDVPVDDHVLAVPDQPEAHEDVVLAPSLQQPTPLDILKSIEALGNKFDSLLKKSDHAEAMHEEIDSRVTALDQQWAQRFATMEKRMQDIESQMDGNIASIGYIANALANPTTARFASFTPPPAGPSAQGHPYGQIPGSWVLKLPGIPDAGQPSDHSVSTVGRQWTTFWDQSKGLEPAGPGDTSASAVQPSGSQIHLSASSQLSSLPSAASSPKD
ncbi:hypothetical protein DFH29DRAFT_876208 [Suillus ampliporus]|nr:hypothetical protein DFH29DRAFT_876208 [Suillus ampliporus]